MDIFTTQEKIQIVKWSILGQSFQEIIRSFIVLFETRPSPSSTTVRRIVQNFETHGCVNPGKHKHEPAVNEEKEMLEVMICGSVEENHGARVRDTAEVLGVSHTTVFKVLRKNGYHSYKLSKNNEIFRHDLDSRSFFCETLMERANQDQDFIRNILFTDESSFTIHGRHNPSVARVWYRGNPHLAYDARTQYPQKLNVWAGILGDNVVGPFIIDGNLNGQKYLHLLQNQILPAVQQLPGVEFENVWFQQDGCPAHNCRPVQAYLNNTFPYRLITGHGGNILWPPRSPDLTPLDFFLWGYVKSQIYGFRENRANDLPALRLKIENCMQAITPEMFENVRQSVYNRLGYCLLAKGDRFEHLI